ncbi:hypothetical protein [Tomitella biformata]|uniref:hypothetical protein n=1 Tax=Tomitella biformata TaxID=630403 RepID=UPI000467A927|nr:hypothetical protein [Tomitella biformata]
MATNEHERPLPRVQALAHGYTDGDLRRMQSRDGWTRLRRGHYLSPELEERLTAHSRHRLLVEATVPRLARDAVVSHQSAAVLHGVTVWQTPLNRVHVTRSDVSAGRRTNRSHLHVAPIPPGETVRIGNIQAVSLARTIADLARTLPFEQAVVAGDHACHRLGLTPPEVTSSLLHLRGRQGVSRGLSTVTFLDGRSESPGESRSRVILSQLGLPVFDLQFEVRDGRGNLVGRSDFALPGHQVLGEFDGKVKYGRYLRPGQTAGDAVFEEKRREDRLRDLGWQVVRWTWGDLAHPQAIADRFARAIDRAATSR